MNAKRFVTTGLAGSLLLALMTACGGGGGDTSPTPAPQTLGPVAGSVTSSDGKVTVSVGDNALQAATAISIAPAAPDAATAADPSLVPGTTYSYTAPAIQVPDQVLITIESPLAVATSARPAPLKGDRRLLAPPPGYVPPPTCLVNAPSVLNGSQTAQNILVVSGLTTQAQCPLAPAPGCIVVWSPNPDVFVCAPDQDVILAPAIAASCPPGYVEVTSEAGYQALAAANGYSRVCERQTFTTPPVLRGSRGNFFANCQPSNGKFLCAAPTMPSGTYSVLWDKEAPPKPTFSAKSTSAGTFVYKDELETGAVFDAAITATDPHGLGSAEVLEVFDTPAAYIVLGKLRVERIWQAAASTFSGTPVTNWNSQTFQIPWDNSAPAKRRFKARVFDKAGNSRLSDNTVALDFFVARIGIESFTVSPSSVQFPGGPVTLTWSMKGAQAASIDNGVGAVPGTPSANPLQASTGSVVVNVTATTTFTITATHPARSTKTASVTVTLGADATPPTVSLAASPSTVVAPGSTTLTATASDNAGVSKVEFFRGSTLIGTDTTAPFTQAVAFTPADIGSVAFTAKAFDAANNSTTSAVLNVTVGADVTPPTASLLANPATVLVPGSTTLQATATDNIGVTKVEFWRGATLIATDTTAPYQTQVDFSAADLGSVSFTAKAFDAQNNSTTSPPVNVLVTTPSAGDTYASPGGVDAGNNACSQAAPCLSIAKAAALAQANKTVWLSNGSYTSLNQPAVIDFPAGLTLRALTPGMAQVSRGIVLQGSATVVGIVIARTGLFETGYIAASSGTLTLDGVKVIGSAFSAGAAGAIALSGTVQATMTPGNITDYADQLSPAGQGAATYASLAGSARLNINGGTFLGAAIGGSANLYAKTGAFSLTGSSRLDINNAVVHVDSYGVVMNGAATQLNMTGSLLHSNVNSGFGAGIYAQGGTPQITLVASTISGFSTVGGSRGITVGPLGNFGLAGVAATVMLTNSSLLDNGVGIWVSDGTTPSSLALTGSNGVISGNIFGGLVCASACAVDLAGGTISGNGTQDASLVGGFTFYGGLWFGSTTKAYQVKLRTVQLIDNKSVLGGNSNQPGNSGITLAGSAASSFDLGTLASPGNNLFAGNTTGSQTTGINVEAAAGVTVSAVGNMFAPNLQQADAQGKYKLGSAPCGAASCNLTTGAGANYRVIGGTLRLAQ